MERSVPEYLSSLLQKTGLPWGICEFSAVKEHLLPCRAAARLPKEARSVLCVAFPYFVSLEKRNISRYAAVADYHVVAMEILRGLCVQLTEEFPVWQWEPFVDNSPIPEVLAGVEAGVGVRGQNGLLLTEGYGSWVFLGEIVTDAVLSPTPKKEKNCRGCGACRRACPVGAIGADGKVDATRCLSALSQKKGDLSPEEEEALRRGGSVWGCDLCQEACPQNRKAQVTPIEEFLRGVQGEITGENFKDLPDRAYFWRGDKVILRNIRILSHETGEF